jgi:site-specific DNA-methyltransferase (adenine-specific)
MTNNIESTADRNPQQPLFAIPVVGSSTVFNAHYSDVMSLFPDKFFDWAVCDIPYGIGVAKMAYLKENKTTVKQKNGTRINPNRNKHKHTLKDWDNATPPQAYFDELRRVSKNQIIFGADYTDWTGLGKGRIKWNKGFSEGVSFNKFEYAYCSCMDYEIEIPLLWAGMMQAKSLSEPMVQQGNKKLNEKRIHPCHKPVMLYDAIFKEFGIYKMKVIDTHLGSGSSRITADKFECEFVGSEIDSEYFQDQENRWFNYKRNLKLALW